MQMFRVNCVYVTNFGNCDYKKKFLGIFKRSCNEYGPWATSFNCSLASRTPKPKIKPALHPYYKGD